MTVSAIVPIFNSWRYLEEAIVSIRAQTVPPAEIVVVDDGSTDGGAELAEALGARCVRQANAGQSAARNAGARHARGELLAFLDADDLWLPDKLEYQTGALLADPALDAVLGHAEVFVSPELAAEERDRLVVRAGPQPGGVPGALLIRADAFARSGGFPDVRVAEFLEWYLRAVEAGLRIEMLPQVVLRRRLHLTNTMRQRQGEHGAYVQALKRARDRRRAPEPRPIVSIIVPVHNGERYLGDALTSVVEQDYRPLEVIVVDDGSTDHTAAIASAFERSAAERGCTARCVHQRRGGLQRARNRGLAEASGRYIGFLDHDDLFLPGKLTRQVQFLETHPDVGIVIAHLENVVEPGDARPRERTADHLPGVSVQVNPGASLVRRAVFDRIGRYEADAPVASDVEWLGRALRDGVGVEIIPDVLLRRRLHASNVSNAPAEKREYFVRTLKFLLDERRRQARAAGPEGSARGERAP